MAKKTPPKRPKTTTVGQGLGKFMANPKAATSGKRYQGKRNGY
jgi:hypothetical protein